MATKTKATTKEKFDWNAFRGKSKIAVNCQTEEEAQQFLKLMDAQGMRWCNGDKFEPNKTYWYNHKERTCYHGNSQYGDIDYANKKGCTVLKFSLLDFD